MFRVASCSHFDDRNTKSLRCVISRAAFLIPSMALSRFGERNDLIRRLRSAFGDRYIIAKVAAGPAHNELVHHPIEKFSHLLQRWNGGKLQFSYLQRYDVVSSPATERARKILIALLRKNRDREPISAVHRDLNPGAGLRLVSCTKPAKLLMRTLIAVTLCKFVKRNRWLDLYIHSLSESHDSDR